MTKRVPQIDAKRIYAVGHSSAATLALQVAENEPRIVACVAFAPACNVSDRVGRASRILTRIEPDLMDAIEQYSPHHNIGKLKCPTMLFTAVDDDNIPSSSVVEFGNTLKQTNKSMIREGIPAAIEWLRKIKP